MDDIIKRISLKDDIFLNQIVTWFYSFGFNSPHSVLVSGYIHNTFIPMQLWFKYLLSDSYVVGLWYKNWKCR